MGYNFRLQKVALDIFTFHMSVVRQEDERTEEPDEIGELSRMLKRHKEVALSKDPILVARCYIRVI